MIGDDFVLWDHAYNVAMDSGIGVGLQTLSGPKVVALIWKERLVKNAETRSHFAVFALVTSAADPLERLRILRGIL